MDAISLSATLEKLDSYIDLQEQKFIVPHGFRYPGFYVAMAATIKRLNFPRECVVSPNDGGEFLGYSSAIALSKALWGVDDYQHRRQNLGSNYSALIHIDNEEAVNSASECITSCIKRLAGAKGNAQGIQNLTNVVGELHDNVWSHGLSSGFSMAQKWKKAKSEDHFFEFAVADTGMGFLDELRRADIQGIADEKDAIEWCITKGNTTKKPADDWAQSVPRDIVGGSPFGGAIRTKHKENNHQGLGLAKLVDLVLHYKGDLCLASGSFLLKLNNKGVKTWRQLPSPWKGVAISCRFLESHLVADDTKAEKRQEIQELMSQLAGEKS